MVLPGCRRCVFYPWRATRRIRNLSPDLTTGGISKKRWRQNKDNTSYLIKAGSTATHTSPLSEILVSILCEKLEIPCVKYDLCVEGTEICSRCDNMITEDTELVSAADIYHLGPRRDGETPYAHLLHECKKLEIPDAEKRINHIILVGNLTGNA